MVGSGGTVLRKGAWTPEEDILLRNCIEIYGEGKWYRVPLKAGLNRCRKSCRLRWLNYLKPNINRGEFQADEVDLMIRLHRLLGNRWSLIAARLPGRTSNDVKNYWNTHIQKKLAISTKEKIMKNQLEIPKTAIFKPRPRTLSKTSPWLIEKFTILENDRNDSNPSDQTVRPFEKDDDDNNNNNHNDNNNNDDDDMWWESILDYNGKSTSSTHDFGEESIAAATMEVGDGTVKEGQLDRWIDVSFEEDPWDIFRAI